MEMILLLTPAQRVYKLNNLLMPKRSKTKKSLAQRNRWIKILKNNKGSEKKN